MKLKEGFVLRELADQYIVSPEGLDVLENGRMFSLNEPAAYLWRQVQGKEFTEETLFQLLVEQYDVPEQTAREDIAALINVLVTFGVVEERNGRDE